MKTIGLAHLFALTTLVFCLQHTAPSYADELPVYKIEVIVFERMTAQDASATRERWPRDIQLGFPANTVTLSEVTPEHSGENTGSVLQLLPSNELSLSRQKNALARNAQLRPLFHQAWLQPLSADSQALAVRISGGDHYDGHQELDGTITLSLSRFVQLQTNLWLAKFTPNQGQPPELWPPLPQWDPPSITDDNLLAEGGDLLLEQQPLEQQPLEQQIPPPAEPADPSPDAWHSAWQAGETLDEPEQVDSAFLVRQIVTLKQSRRMRSGEVHYLDHPRLGVLIQVQSHKATGSP